LLPLGIIQTSLILLSLTRNFEFLILNFELKDNGCTIKMQPSSNQKPYSTKRVFSLSAHYIKKAGE